MNALDSLYMTQLSRWICVLLLTSCGLERMSWGADLSVDAPRWLKLYQPRSGDEQLIFTPVGFDQPGQPAIARGEHVARLRITIVDAATGQPTPCRMNVVGRDGNFYQPQPSHLTPYSLTGMWPKTLAGNRPGKAPIRYFGRFFYTTGTCEIFVPPGPVRLEVWKGLEFAPQTLAIEVKASEVRELSVELTRVVDMAATGWYSGDPHLHFDRRTDEDDQTILDLMEAEDVRYGSILCYNGTSSYDGRMSGQDIPQERGLGIESIHRRGEYRIMSAQEYRSAHYGHTKVFLSDQLVQAGRSYDPNTWPVFGEAVREIRENGGIVFWAHGGYSKEIFADYLLGAVDGVELMQFGIYRPIGLEGWYKILNIGYRFPALGASDFPACRKLADCRTYIYADQEPSFEEWLRAAAAGRSFFTTGPLLLLEVAGKRPGSIIEVAEDLPTRLKTKIRVRSEVAPVTHVDLVINGRVEQTLRVPRQTSTGRWLEMTAELNLTESSWIAASAYSSSATGNPDAEAHTNPVYVYRGKQRPYAAADLNWLLAKLDGRIAFHTKRKISTGKEQVLRYFERARAKLIELRTVGGQTIQRR